MKRSEAVRDLAIMLMGRLPEWEKQERLNFADEILEQLEIMGMLPQEGSIMCPELTMTHSPNELEPEMVSKLDREKIEKEIDDFFDELGREE